METMLLPEPPRKARKARTYRPNPVPLNQREWLSPQEAADYACMGLSTLYLYMKHNYIAFSKRGRSTIIKREIMDEFQSKDRPVIAQEKNRTSK